MRMSDCQMKVRMCAYKFVSVSGGLSARLFLCLQILVLFSASGLAVCVCVGGGMKGCTNAPISAGGPALCTHFPVNAFACTLFSAKVSTRASTYAVVLAGSQSPSHDDQQISGRTLPQRPRYTRASRLPTGRRAAPRDTSEYERAASAQKQRGFD